MNFPPKASVIIPSYNDADVLEKCLKHLSLQKEKNFEVIVVDDGSKDDTQKILGSWKKKKYPFLLHTLKQKNQGAGVARNTGMKKAKEEIVIFLDADILVSENWLSEHLKFHHQFKQETQMGVGFMTWSPEFADNRFRKWLESSGTMLSFKGLKNYKKTDFWHFYTGNISLKKSFIQKHPFNEGFRCYGWEDIMLGYELIQNQKGELYYLKNASAFHHQNMKEADVFPEKMRKIGKSAIYFESQYPQATVIPKGLKLLIFKTLSTSFMLNILSVIKKEWWWYALSKKYFLEGIDEEKEKIQT